MSKRSGLLGRILCLSITWLYASVAMASTATAQTSSQTQAKHGPGLSLPLSSQVESVYHFAEGDGVSVFDGTLDLRHVDLSLSLAGGMELTIARTYNSGDGLSKSWSKFAPIWSFAVSKIMPILQRDKSYHYFMTFNDGSKRQLFLAESASNAYISKDGWHGLHGSATFEVVDNNGTTYSYVARGYEKDSRPHSIPYTNFNWYVLTKVRDIHGNGYDISYYPMMDQGKNISEVMKQITTTDHRVIKFEKGDCGNPEGCIAKMTFAGQVWQYHYDESRDVKHTALLASVDNPDGTHWRYGYARQKLLDVGIGKVYYPYVVQTTMPSGGQIEYGYDQDNTFLNNSYFLSTLNKHVVKDAHGKVLSSCSVGSSQGGRNSLNINCSDKTVQYVSMNKDSGNNLHQIGELLEKKVTDKKTGQVVFKAQYEWEKQRIASVPYTIARGRVLLRESATYAARLSKITTTLGSSRYVIRYADFDLFGNPKMITEEGDVTKTLRLSYFNNTEKNIFGKLKSVTQDDSIKSLVREYTSEGQVSSESKHGMMTRYYYHSSGDLNSVIDALGHPVQYPKYKYGVPLRKVDQAGGVTSQKVDLFGNVISKTDANLETTHYTYDAMRKVLSVTPPRGAKTTITYHAGGVLDRTVTTRGNLKTVTDGDGFGRTVSTQQTDLDSNRTITTTTKYDQYGQPIFKSFPQYGQAGSMLGAYTKYDALGRVVKVQYPYGDDRDSIATTVYTDGNKVTKTDANGHTTVYTYQVTGDSEQKKLIKIESPEGLNTTIARDALGNVTKVSQGNLSRQYIYDQHHQVEQEISPEVGILKLERDKLGQVLSKTYNGSKLIKYSYDSLGRVLTESTVAGTTTRYTYDDNGNTSSVDNGVVRWNYTYDENNNLTGEEAEVAALGETFSLLHEYDDNDHLLATTYPSGKRVTYTPNAFGKATELGDLLSDVTFAANGHLLTTTNAAGVHTRFSYDDRGRPTALQVGDLLSSQMTYDKNNNITRVIDKLDPQYDLNVGYDALDRVTTANGYWGTGKISYDAQNNIATKQFGSHVQAFRYDQSRNSLLMIYQGEKLQDYLGYDNFGNMNSRGGVTFNYDFHNRLQRVSKKGQTTRYQYDGNEQRVVVDDNGALTYTLTDRKGHPFYRYKPDGNHRESLFYLDDNLAAKADNAGKVTYFHWDSQGNAVASSDDKGTLRWKKVYQPFGLEVTEDRAGLGDEGFGGKLYNPESGLNYFGGRYYDPVLARFVSVDPADVDPEQPFSFNRYIYANNNPYRYRDVDGRWPTPVLGINIIEGFFGAAMGAYTGWTATHDINGLVVGTTFGAVTAVMANPLAARAAAKTAALGGGALATDLATVGTQIGAGVTGEIATNYTLTGHSGFSQAMIGSIGGHIGGNMITRDGVAIESAFHAVLDGGFRMLYSEFASAAYQSTTRSFTSSNFKSFSFADYTFGNHNWTSINSFDHIAVTGS